MCSQRENGVEPDRTDCSSVWSESFSDVTNSGLYVGALAIALQPRGNLSITGKGVEDLG